MFEKLSLFKTKIMMVFLFTFMFVLSIPAYAQTPVPLNIPIDSMFTSANTWMASLGPVLAIGFGISIALALLTLVGGLIINALRSAGKKS